MFLQYLLGVCFEGPGYTNVHIRPFLPQGQTFVKGHVQIPGKGPIQVVFNREQVYTLDVETPVKACVGVPRPQSPGGTIRCCGVTIWDGGKHQPACPGVRWAGEDAHTVFFCIEPGRVCFLAMC
jgi:hypothetical protein